MKIVGSDKGLRSPEFHKKKEKERKWRLIIGVILFVVIVLAPIFILRSSKLQIKNIAISGNDVTTDEELQGIIMDNLSGNYGYIIPRSSSVFYPKEKIRSDILSLIPRITAADLSLDSLTTLTLAVSERMPDALYCGNVTTGMPPADCFFVDKMGYIFSAAPAFSGGVYTVYTTNPGIEAPLGKELLPAKKFADVEKFLKDVAALHLTPKAVLLQAEEFDLFLPSGTVIKWKPEDDMVTVLSNLTSFWNDKTILKNGQSQNDLLYIDLRFGNKVFYKFKSE